jgi:hypothetical protein
MIFVMICLRMAYVQAETRSIYVSVTKWIKTNLCYLTLNKCGLFSDKHKDMVAKKIA